MNDYDAVIIGSGSGGLTAALALACAGKRVAVFEQHTHIGGYSQSFSLDGFQFSPGIHYIGQLQDGGRLRRIYEGLGVANDLVFLELDPDGYDRVFVGDDRFDIPKGSQHFRERLRQRFPLEQEGIDRYFDLVERIADELVWARPGPLREMAKLPYRMRTVLRHGLTPVGRLLKGLVSDPLLRAILTIQSGDHGMAPARAPMALHAGLQSYYFDGACYPRGGGHAIPDALVEAHPRSIGGEVFVSAAAVERILVESRASGPSAFELARRTTRSSAEVRRSPTADPGVTWGRARRPGASERARLRRRMAKPPLLASRR